MRAEAAVRNSLRAVRARLGLSQADLAQAAGVTRQTISGLESGAFAPSAAVALRLGRALGCRVEELFWLDEDLPPLTADLTAPAEPGARVSLAQVGGRWVAASLRGSAAFRAEMIPCDGVLLEAEGARAQVRPLDDPDSLRRTVALAGCTPVLSLWARAAERWHPGLRVAWRFANSTEALAALARGEVHAAGVHLVDPHSGQHNAPFVRRAAPGADIALVHLGIWEEGFAVRAGNPLALSTGADLARPGVRLINRERGAGARMLLDETLAAAGVAPDQVAGFRDEAEGHLAVAEAVARGAADVGVTSAAVAAAFDLGFVPLREVRYDLAVPRAFLDYPPVRQLLSTLEHRWVRSQLALLGGYRTDRTGELVTAEAAA
jgi:putative molybdopterin biosynthesis protein